MVKVPLHQAGDAERTVSRIPSGGFAVLDTVRSARVSEKGELPKKTLRVPSIQNLYAHAGSITLVEPGNPRRLGLSDFVRASDDCQFLSQRQSACQMEALIFRRIPFKHLASSSQALMSANRSKTGSPPPTSQYQKEVN